MNYKYEMLTLNFDMTRRCNLRCKFCARGESQNQDITPDVIDATLDQLDGVYIGSLRMSGGEPFLAPDMISYLIDGIIKRRLVVYSVGVFSNGAVRDPKIAIALKRLAEYFESRDDIERLDTVDTYTTSEKYRIAIIVSEDFHETTEEAKRKTIEFYSDIHPLIGIDLQNNAYAFPMTESITLEGLARDNITDLVGKSDVVNGLLVRCIEDKYGLMDWILDKDEMPRTKIVTKAITVSSNGHIFPGRYSRFSVKSDCDGRKISGAGGQGQRPTANAATASAAWPWQVAGEMLKWLADGKALKPVISIAVGKDSIAFPRRSVKAGVD